MPSKNQYEKGDGRDAVGHPRPPAAIPDSSGRCSRRGVLIAGARFAALGGLAAVTAALGRRATDGAASAACRRKGVCRGCGEVATCILPAAATMRRAGGLA